MKVVYNGCYGGFSLSDKAIQRYVELKGVKLYEKPDGKFSGLSKSYYTTPDFADGSYFACYDIPRTDPILVQVVEELGNAADGKFANLLIQDVPAGQRWRIDEYDGIESIMTVDDYEWNIAT